MGLSNGRSHVAVAAVGLDRPGIVAAVTGVLVEEGCNLEDTSMSILRGHFAMMLVVASPPEVAAGELEKKIAQATADFDLVVSVRPIGDDVPDAAEGDRWTVVVYGADRPGIVHRIATELAEAGVNIEDLTTRVAGDEDRAIYTMVLEVVVPAGVEAAELGRRVEAAAGELGVEASLHPSEADIL